MSAGDTTLAAPGTTAPTVARGRLTQARVARAEWTKLWSLRSTRWSLLVACLAMAGLGPLVAAIRMGRWAQLGPHDRASFDAVGTSLAGYHLAQLAIGVLGVLVLTGEYTTGQIRSTFLAEPRRLPVLWAKAVVFALVAFVLMVISALLAFFISQAILSQHHVQTTLGDAPALRAVIGCGLYLGVLGIFSMSLGGLVRSTAGGIALFAGLFFVPPGIVAVLPQSTQNAINPYLLMNAGPAVLAGHREVHTFSAWGGFGVFCAYTAVLLAAAAVLMLRRDT